MLQIQPFQRPLTAGLGKQLQQAFHDQVISGLEPTLKKSSKLQKANDNSFMRGLFSQDWWLKLREFQH
jgi:hypothetical protein